jgi:quercetin dioxygenase-like cupin family protein
MVTERHRDFDVLGIHIRFVAFPEENGGNLCVVEGHVREGLGAPPNIHDAETECFVVTEGSFDFSVDGVTHDVRAGQSVVVPAGVAHGFRCTSAGGGRMYVINTPGHVHAKFFSEAGTPLPSGFEGFPEPAAPDIPHVMRVGEAAGITFLPPQA